MNRRIISLAIALILLLPSTGFSFYDERGNGIKDNQVHAETLIALRILNGVKYDEIRPMGGVTRYEFINCICNVFADYGFNYEYSEQAVNYAFSYGLIDSVENFSPHTYITYEQAIKVAVCALGYKSYALNGMDYPQNYLNAALKCDILDNVEGSVGKSIRMMDAINLIYNVINAEALVQTVYGGEHGKFETEKGRTLLSEYRGIRRVSGQVTATPITMLYSSDSLAQNTVCIDTQMYATAVDTREYIGMRVEAYVDEKNEEKGLPKLLYIYENTAKQRFLRIDSRDINGIDADMTSLDYSTEKKKSVKAAISPAVRVIYNGKYDGNYTTNSFTPQDGYIELIDVDSNGAYDVARVNESETMIVDRPALRTGVLYNRYKYNLPSIDLMNIEENGTLIVTDGIKTINYRDLKQNDVVSIVASLNAEKPYAHITVCRKTVTGKLNGLDHDSQTMTIDEAEYTQSASFISANAASDPMALNVKPGREYSYYLNARGEVVGLELLNEEIHYGFALKLGTDKGIAQAVQMKIFAENGEWYIYNMAEKLTHNGGKKKSAKSIYDELAPFEPQLVGYKLNVQNEITSIETAVSDNHDYNSERLRTTGLIMRENSQDSSLSHKSRSFGNKYFFEDNMTMFIVPYLSREMSDEEKEDETLYRVTTSPYYYPQYYHFDFAAYNLDEYGFSNLFAVESRSFGTPDTERFFVVERVTTVYDENGNEECALTGAYMDYSKLRITATSPEFFAGIDRGDIVAFNLNPAGQVSSAEDLAIIYDRSEADKKLDADTSSESSDESIANLSGIVKSIDFTKGRFIVDTGRERVFRIYGNTLVYIFNENNETVYKGTINDIEPNDYVVIRSSDTVITDMVIYKKLNQ